MSKKNDIAAKIAELLPTLIRHMYPYVFQPIPMPPSQVLALVSIQERGGCTLSQLRAEMHVSAPTVTGIIDRLERDGYVQRRTDRADRRVKNVVLTAKGTKVIEQFHGNIRKRWEYILSKTPVETAEVMLNVMQVLTRRFKDGSI